MQEGSAEELLAFLRPDETAASLLSRAYVERRLTNVPFIDAHVGLKAGRLLEIAGPTGSGKTEVLIQLSVNCILPKTHSGVVYGGSEGVAVFVDLDGRFQPTRLKKVLDAHIAATLEAQTGSRAIPQGLPQACLQRFHLIQCHSSFEFLSVLRLLDHILTKLQEFGLPKLLVIDNISAFYWLDRANRTVARTPSANGAVVPLSLQRVQKAVARELDTAARSFHLAVVVTAFATVVVRRDNPDDENIEGEAIWEKKENLTPVLSGIFSQQLLVFPNNMLPSWFQGDRCCKGIAAYWKVPTASHIYMFQVTDGIPQYGLLE